MSPKHEHCEVQFPSLSVHTHTHTHKEQPFMQLTLYIFNINCIFDAYAGKESNDDNAMIKKNLYKN